MGKRQELLSWVQNRLGQYENVEIRDFSTSWKDGLAFCALVHSINNQLFDYFELTPDTPRKNLELAFNVAEDQLGITALLDVEDITDYDEPEESIIISYVSEFRKKYGTSNYEEQTNGQPQEDDRNEDIEYGAYDYDYNPQDKANEYDDDVDDNGLPPPPTQKKMPPPPKQQKKKSNLPPPPSEHWDEAEEFEREKDIEDYEPVGGICGDRKIGIPGVFEIGVRWNQLPIMCINPKFCSNICGSKNCPMLIFAHAEFIIHIYALLFNALFHGLYWMCMIWIAVDHFGSSFFERVARILISPNVLVIGLCLLIPFEFVFKYWAIYAAGVTKKKITSAIGYSLYIMSSIILLAIHVYCFVGYCGTMGFFSLIETAVEGNSDDPSTFERILFNVTCGISALNMINWFICICATMVMFICMCWKCRGNFIFLAKLIQKASTKGSAETQ